ncbi:hypothetical protein CEUSTIGMA_g6181.t1 [Chlamydomonas eustigma]|uniref:DNA-directed RNA polymerase I subunit rpa49 n=1 Tax=Chlamydomonas eustigma TaxID=1157962 RepID=A0A250X6M9_9CHLO|nr:hypothetical protein CEUSTIGMA_g6181.t1 [Chlamydomonas eustigma]|eukprot:GAX78744.1 hypothetical protein CEUSTIGMA_g6181.t1 [Chlamydomonas eustigma]
MVKRKAVQIEVPPCEPSSLPLACYFPTGRPSDIDSIDISLYNSHGARNVQNILVGRRDNMDYVGSTSSQEYTSLQSCSYAIGVFDKVEGKVRLLPLQGGKVLRMEARLHGLEYGPSGTTGQEASTREEQLAMNKRLVDSFGSTRRRRQLNAREEGVVRADKLGSVVALTQVLQSQANKAKEQGHTKDEVLLKAAQERNLPPHHPEATTPSEAYRLEELIPVAWHPNLETEQLVRAAHQPDTVHKLRAKQTVPEYILGRLHLLRDGDKAKALQNARCLATLSAMLALVKGRPDIKVNSDRGGLDAVAQRFHMKPGLLQELLDLFYNRSNTPEGDKYEMATAKKELMLAYILVISQLVEGGGLAAPQFEALKEELKMKPADLAKRFREVGSTCVATSYKPADVEGDSTGKGTPSYNVIMLKDPTKTLVEAFPSIKVGPKRK